MNGAAFEVDIDELVAEGEGREAGHGHVEVDAAGISEGPLGGASTEEGSVVIERDSSGAWGSDKRRKGGLVKEWEWGSHRCLLLLHRAFKSEATDPKLQVSLKA